MENNTKYIVMLLHFGMTRSHLENCLTDYLFGSKRHPGLL